MHVKQRLSINTTVMIVSVLGLMVVLAATTDRVLKALEQNYIAESLLAAHFERLTLGTDYLRTGSERALEQLHIKNRQIDGLLSSAAAKFRDPAEGKVVATLRANQGSVEKIFGTILATRRNGTTKGGDAAHAGDIEDRLLTQLNMRGYEAVQLNGELQEASNATLVVTLRTAVGLSVAILLLVSTVTLVNSATMQRTIAGRIGTLCAGAAAIGKGDLDHRTAIAGDDEFAELSAAFDVMAGKLDDSYRRLESEVAERRRAEETLREKNEALARLNRFMVGRELRMVELKQEVDDGRARMGLPPRYVLDKGAEP